MADYDWILGLSLAILITIVLTVFVSIKDGKLQVSGKVFFIFLPIGLAISVYANLLDLWYFIFSFIFAIIIIFFEIKSVKE